MFWRRGVRGFPPVSSAAYEVLHTPRMLGNPPFWVMILFLATFYLRGLSVLIRLRPEVCLAHQLDALPLALFAKRLGLCAKVVFDNEDVYSLMIHRSVPIAVRTPISYVERWLAATADLRLYPNSAMREYMRDYSATSTAIFPNVPERSFEEFAQTPLLGGGERKSDFIVVYCGFMARDRGLETLVKALGRLEKEGENVSCTLIGDGPVASKLRALASVLGISSRIKFLGSVERTKIPLLLSACDASIVLNTRRDPMNWIGNPNKLYESMSLGIPVIASNFGEIGRIVTEADCGISVNPEDVNEVVSAIQTLARDPLLRRKLSLNGKEFIRRKYSSRTHEEQLIQALRKLVQARH